MKFKIVLVGLLLAGLPVVAWGAGFAKQSLFLSKGSVTEGEVVLIHAVIQNDAAVTFSGEVTFTDEGAKIGTVPVKLGAGEAQAASISWKPDAGSHKVVVELKSGTKTVETLSETFTVKEKPKPAATPAPAAGSGSSQGAAVQSSQQIQNGIASVSPQTAEVVAPFFTLVDGGRAKAAEVLGAQVENTKKSIGPSEGNVLSADTAKNATSDPMGTFWLVLQTLYLYLLTILLFLVSNAAVFYPLLAILVLYLLWRLFKRFRRPAY